MAHSTFRDAEAVRGILTAAEQRLRTLIEQALADQRYRDVAILAAIADQQADLAANLGAEGVSRTAEGTFVGDVVTGATQNKPGQEREPQPSIQRGRRYPRFVRDGQKLVKVGWSKKDSRTYEHRAPKSAVLAFAESVASLSDEDGAGFTMESLLPIEQRGTEVPTYQAYLALAWLRDVGAIKRKGKNTYVLQPDRLQRETVEKYWKQLPDRD